MKNEVHLEARSVWPTGNFVTLYFYKYIPADLFVAPLKSICMSPCSVRPALRLASCSTFSEKCLKTESRGGGGGGGGKEG